MTHRCAPHFLRTLPPLSVTASLPIGWKHTSKGVYTTNDGITIASVDDALKYLVSLPPRFFCSPCPALLTSPVVNRYHDAMQEARPPILRQTLPSKFHTQRGRQTTEPDVPSGQIHEERLVGWMYLSLLEVASKNSTTCADPHPCRVERRFQTCTGTGSQNRWLCSCITFQSLLPSAQRPLPLPLLHHRLRLLQSAVEVAAVKVRRSHPTFEQGKHRTFPSPDSLLQMHSLSTSPR